MNDLIDPADFISQRMVFSLRNTTTQVECKQKDQIQLVEFLDRGMLLELPPKTCAFGHHLLLDLRLMRGESELLHFSCTANVAELESYDQCDQVSLNFIQFEETEWAKLQESFSSRQSEIENFFKAARGY